LGVGGVGCIVGDVACTVGGIIGWRVGCSVGCRIGRLHHFVFTLSLFSYWLKGTIATTSLARMFRFTPGVGACDRSAVSRVSFFNLSGGDADMSLETPYHMSVLKLT
jgi:hypothetical protein